MSMAGEETNATPPHGATGRGAATDRVHEDQGGPFARPKHRIDLGHALQFLHAEPGEFLPHRLDHHFGVRHLDLWFDRYFIAS